MNDHTLKPVGLPFKDRYGGQFQIVRDERGEFYWKSLATDEGHEMDGPFETAQDAMDDVLSL